MNEIPENRSIQRGGGVTQTHQPLPKEGQRLIADVAKNVFEHQQTASQTSLNKFHFVKQFIFFPLETIKKYFRERSQAKAKLNQAAVDAVDMLKIKDLTKRDDVVEAVKKLMGAGTSKRKMQEAVKKVNCTLKSSKIEAQLIEKEGKVRVLLRKTDTPLGQGAFKKCWHAIKVGGSARAVNPMRRNGAQTYFKERVVFTSVTWLPRDLNFFRQEVEDAVEFSKQLRREGVPHRELFMKYKKVTYKNGKEVETTLMADFAEGGELKGELPKLTGEKRLDYFRQLLQAGSAMESAGLVHRDLKTENIFLKDGHIVIGDYGLMVKTSNCNRYIAGTPGYLPEAMQGVTDEENTRAQDRYAMGMIFLEIATGGSFQPSYSLFPSGIRTDYCDPQKYLRLMRQLEGMSQENPLAGLIAKLLESDITKRITLTQALAEFDALNLTVQQCEINI